MTAQYSRLSSDQFRYVIVAPSFDENGGGVIALHYLCHMLNESGVDASLAQRPRPKPAHSRNRLRAFAGAQSTLQSHSSESGSTFILR